MNLGKSVSFHVHGRTWTIKPFSLEVWMEFVEWLKSRPKGYDPLEQVNKLPLERMPPELVERLVSKALEEDRELHDFRPESEATRRELLKPEGIIKAISLLSSEPEADVRAMVLALAAEDRVNELTDAMQQTMGNLPAKKAQAA